MLLYHNSSKNTTVFSKNIKGDENKLEFWTASAVGLMHLHKITQKELANHIGVTDDYISMILNGKKTPKGAEERISNAIDEIIKLRSRNNS